MKQKRKLVSLIVRTKNEEFWIERFLKAVNSQKTAFEIEIILVDNHSIDATVERALSINRDIKVATIEDYVPGTALNSGVSVATGDFVVCISAHCIPANKHWLDNLVGPLQNDTSVACVYGRQLPLETSSPQDKRDLWLTFGLDDKLQKKDPFIHNANAAYRRKDLLCHPFSEEMTNIEDRGWAEEQLSKKMQIFYCAGAEVYHGHGIHQTGNIRRLEGVVNMMESLSTEFGRHEDYYGANSRFCLASKCLIIPVSERYHLDDMKELSSKEASLKLIFHDWKIYVMPSAETQIKHINELGFEYLPFRLRDTTISNLLISDLSRAVQVLTSKNQFYDYVASFDIRKPLPTTEFLTSIINKMQRTGVSCGVAIKESGLSTCKSVSGKDYFVETSGWKRWVKNEPQDAVHSLSPSNFIVAEMNTLRYDSQLKAEFCTEKLM